MSDIFAEFKIIPAASGEPIAVHLPSGLLLQSRYNPVQESAELAKSQPDNLSHYLVLGGGLGYYPEALLHRTVQAAITVIEPDAALFQLGRKWRGTSDYYCSPRMRVITVSTPASWARVMNSLPKDSGLFISPYLARLAARQNSPLAGVLTVFRSEMASRSVYNDLIDGHSKINDALLRVLPAAGSAPEMNRAFTVIAGAAPSLDQCLPALTQHRAHCEIIAASGAVPALLHHGVEPDWVVALEARESIIRDLEKLPPQVRIIVFECTHPHVLTAYSRQLWTAADRQGALLQTGGGSSVIPALDFAFRRGRGQLLLVGADLGYQNGSYAANSLRSELPEKNDQPPKFLSMRSGLEAVIYNRRDLARTLFHVLPNGIPLMGSRVLHPSGLLELFQSKVVPEVSHA
jgi:hypothetical protein